MNRNTLLSTTAFLAIISLAMGNQATAADIDELNDIVAQHTTEIEGLTTDVEGLTTSVGGLTTDVAQNTANIATHTSDIESLKSSSTTYGNDISSLKTSVETQGNAISDLNDTILSHSSDIASLKTSVETYDSQISDLTAQTVTLSNDIASLTTKSETHDTQISNLNDQAVTLSNDVASLTTKTETHDTQISDLSDKVYDHQASIATNTANIAQNASDIAENKASIAENAANIVVNAENIAQNATDIDNLENAFGGAYESGAFNYEALEGNGFVETANLTSALNAYAQNVSSALGGSFDTRGNFSVSIDNGADVDYGTLETDNLAQGISQVASNIGAAVNSTTNGVAKTNTVNENIDALNGVIGNVDAFHVSDNLSIGTGEKPTSVVEAINNIDDTLGTIHGLANKLEESGKYKGNLAEGTTVEDHLTALDKAIGNRDSYSNTHGANGYVATAGADVATAISEIASNVGSADDLGPEMNDVSAHNTVNANIAAVNQAVGDVDTLADGHYTRGTTNVTDAVRRLDSHLYRLDNEVSDLRHDFRAGMASMAAMTALVPNARAWGDTQISFGTGAYNGHTAMAVGGFRWVGRNVLLNAGAAWGNTRDVSYRMGVTYSW